MRRALYTLPCLSLPSELCQNVALISFLFTREIPRGLTTSEREGERERYAKFPAGARDASFRLGSVCRTSPSRSISVVSRLRGYFPCLFLLYFLLPGRDARSLLLSRLASPRAFIRYIRANFARRKDEDTSELPSNWAAVSLESHVCELSRWAKCTNANGAFYDSIAAGNVL